MKHWLERYRPLVLLALLAAVVVAVPGATVSILWRSTLVSFDNPATQLADELTSEKISYANPLEETRTALRMAAATSRRLPASRGAGHRLRPSLGAVEARAPPAVQALHPFACRAGVDRRRTSSPRQARRIRARNATPRRGASMDTITLARLIGLVIVIAVFVITVLLMPRIFGVNPGPTAAGAPPSPPEPAAPPAPAAARDARRPVATPAARPLAKS